VNPAAAAVFLIIFIFLFIKPGTTNEAPFR
jgi:hypothetical protein